MKDYICIFVFILLWFAFMPMIIRTEKGQACSAPAKNSGCEQQETQPGEQSGIPESEANAFSPQIRWYNSETQSTELCDIELYVARAVSALMDEGSPPEALKAQAVAVRSVVCCRCENPVHQGFELCDKEDHCFRLCGKARKECLRAAEATKGIILTCEGKAALALSHRSSCVSTESYANICGKPLPYLVSVKVPDESGFDGFKTELRLSTEEYENRFAAYNTSFSEENRIGALRFTDGNRVYTIESGGLCFRGSTFASLFGLPSLCFNVSQKNGYVTISCYGDGNGAGMSRMSAVLMVQSGKNYMDILRYFYPQTDFSHIRTA